MRTSQQREQQRHGCRRRAQPPTQPGPGPSYRISSATTASVLYQPDMNEQIPVAPMAHLARPTGEPRSSADAERAERVIVESPRATCDRGDGITKLGEQRRTWAARPRPGLVVLRPDMTPPGRAPVGRVQDTAS
jgi:hypothetical protein